jgi:hypothetical protein
MLSDSRGALIRALPVGLLAGLMFYLNALLPQSFLYPLVWPLLAGAFVVSAVRRLATKPARTKHLIVLAGGVGELAGIVFLLLSTLTLYWVGGSAAAPDVRRAASGQPPLNRAVFTNLLMMALIAIPAAAIIGGLLVTKVHLRRNGPAATAESM